jgi:hypothetical protein
VPPNRPVIKGCVDCILRNIYWIVNTMGMNNLKIKIKFIENPFSSSQVVIFV